MNDPVTVRMVRDAFNCSYTYATTNWTGGGSFFNKAQRASMAYERVIDSSRWQTRSEVYFGFAKTAVDVMLPNVLWYIFNEDNLFNLVPMNTEATYEEAQKTRDYLHYELNSVMNVWLKAYPTVKDAAKLGCGYGMVDVEYVTPWEWVTTEVKGIPIPIVAMKSSKPIYQPRYRYIRFPRILPSPGGGGSPEDRDWVIFVDHVPENELKAMMDDPNCPVKGDYEKIVARTRDGYLDGRICSLTSLYSRLCQDGTSLQMPDLQNTAGAEAAKKMPCLVPVIKYYGKSHHIWLANGETPIYDVQNSAQTLRNPVLKATVYPDGDEWFADGIISANEDMFEVNNIVANTILDLVDVISRPRFAKNKQMVPGELALGPWGVTDVFGPVRDAIVPLDIARVPPELVAILDRLQEFQARSTGHTQQLEGQGAAGLMRGGAGAFESLLATTGNRDKLAADVLDMCLIKPLVENLLLVEQLVAGQDGERSYQRRNAKKESQEPGSVWYDNLSITSADLRKTYRVEISLKDKLRNTLADMNQRATIAQVIMTNPLWTRMVNMEALMDYLVGNRVLSQQLRVGANPARTEGDMSRLAEMGLLGKGPQTGQEGPSKPSQRGIPGVGGEGGDASQKARKGGVNA